MRRLPSWRLVASGIAFVMILMGAFQPDYLRILLSDRSALSAHIDHLRFGKMPEIRPFLEEVERRTPGGSSIVLVIPARDWNLGYEYAFYRASYVAAGRTVLPVMNPAGDPLAGNLQSADFVAAWRVPLDPSQYRIVWQGEDGALARRR